MNTTGPANKRKGVSHKPKAPHPTKTDGKFGSKTNYADTSKTHIGTNGKAGSKKLPSK